MSKQKTKSNKKSIIITSIISLIAITTAIILSIVFLVIPKKEPTAIMECSIATPSTAINSTTNGNNKTAILAKSTNSLDVQFILDQNNKVMSVNYLNDNAYVLLKEAKLKGKSAENSAQLFVELATKAGYVKIDATVTDGTRVDISIQAKTSKEIEDLKESVKAKVNKYFDKNGIIAGAVVSIGTNLLNAIEKTGLQVSEIVANSPEKILTQLDKTAKELDGIAVKFHSQIFDKIYELRKDQRFNKLPQIEANIDTLEKSLTKNENKIKNSENLSKNEKDALLQASKEIKTELKNLKKDLQDLQKEFDKVLDDFIETFRQESVKLYNTAKSELNQIMQNATAKINEHKKTVLKNTTKFEKDINTFRAKLENATK